VFKLHKTSPNDSFTNLEVHKVFDLTLEYSSLPQWRFISE